MFDLIRLDEDHILVYMADISGHGVRSSLLTMFLRQAIRGLRATTTNLPAIIEDIIKSFIELHLADEQYFSLLLGLYSIKQKEWRFLNAGHNCLPIIIRAQGGIEEIRVKGMPICSLLKEADHEEKAIMVSKGDKVLFYTDGITEAFNESKLSYFGEERMISILEANAKSKGSILVEEIIKKAKAFSGAALVDDAAVFVVEIV
jgi:sigma-B regulation protein RsbU (phosphoserine phosphatase)